MQMTRIREGVAPRLTRSFSTCTMLPPVAIMGSLTSTRSSGPMTFGSLFRYSIGCKEHSVSQSAAVLRAHLHRHELTITVTSWNEFFFGMVARSSYR